MLIAAVVVSTLLTVAAFAHFVIAVYFRTRVMLQAQRSDLPDDRGLASIILSIRGHDPGLRQALIQLLDQDYENYEVHLVVDHRRDHAWEMVHQVKSQFDENRRLTIHEMRRPLKTCGLKCSSLLQGLENIHPHTRYLVLVDADVTPHRTWLSQLVAPLSDERIGVVTGNQWFEPQAGNAGSLLRSLWNAGALVPTAIYNNPWAGTFAMRMKDVRRARLPIIWRKSIVDDGPIREALRPLGLQIYFNPALIMVNRDRCTYRYVRRYMARMLTWSRMYESTFLNTLIHCLGTVGLLVASLAMMLVSVTAGMWQSVAVLGGGLVVFSGLNVLAYLVVRNAAATSSNLEEHPLGRLRVMRLIKLVVLSPLAYLIYGFACFQAATRRQIQWRQITYRLKGKSRVKMVRYRPWVAEERDQLPSEVSL